MVNQEVNNHSEKITLSMEQFKFLRDYFQTWVDDLTVAPIIKELTIDIVCTKQAAIKLISKLGDQICIEGFDNSDHVTEKGRLIEGMIDLLSRVVWKK